MSAAQVAEASRRTTDFRREGGAKPAFVAGQKVRARLAGCGRPYAPAALCPRPTRIIHAYHGNHLLPDAGAKGQRGRSRSIRAFRAADLWPERQASRDRIFLDLWESYLEP
jgi:Nitrile hydratase beta subunit.